MGEPDIAARSRVQLGYELEQYGAIRTVRQPFVVVVTADLHGDSTADDWRSPLADRRLLTIDLDNRDARIQRMRPAVRLDGDGATPVLLEFESLDDFSPLGLARRHPATRGLLDRRTVLAEVLSRLIAHRDLVAPWCALVADPPAPGGAPPPWLTTADDDPRRAAAGFATLLEELHCGALGTDADPVGALRDRIQALDATIGQHVTAALTDPAFRRLEAAWRGVDHLLQHLGPPELSRVRLLSLRRDELSQALARAGGDLDSKLIDQEFGMLGGEPVGVWVLGDEFSQVPQDVRTLRAAAGLASRANALVVAAASPVLLDSDAHATAASARCARLQRLPEYAAWRDLRADPVANHLALVLPRVAARGLHALAGLGSGEFRYLEPPPCAARAPWMSAAFVVAAAVLKVQVRDGWPAAMDTASGPVAWPAAAAWTGVDATGTLRVCAPLDAEFTTEEAAELAAFGLTVLGRVPGSTAIQLLAAPTMSAAQGRVGAPLAVVLALNEIARWLRCWQRDREATDPDLPSFEAHLRARLARVTASDSAAGESSDDEAPAEAALLLQADVVGLQATADPQAREAGDLSITVRLRLQLSLGFRRSLPALPLVVTLPVRVRGPGG